jgi:hypothetical protein
MGSESNVLLEAPQASHMVGELLHSKETHVWGDAAYSGRTERIKAKAPKAKEPVVVAQVSVAAAAPLSEVPWQSRTRA